MPFGAEGIEPGTVGLALSGGGFRATLFHCGTLWRLNELGFLRKLTRVSSVSGGSITAGVLARAWPNLSFSPQGIATRLDSLVIKPLRDFCAKAIDVPAIMKGTLTPWRSVGDYVQKAYDDALFHGMGLKDLPPDVRFIFNATNLSTGVDFRFSRPYAGDYRIGLIDKPQLPVALAVAASSAFPPVLSPVILNPDPASFKKTDGADLYDDVAYRQRVILTDGGAYDNLGLETLVKRIETVLVSDAGGPFTYVAATSTDWLRQPIRVLDIAVNQARALRKRPLIDAYQHGRPGAYWGIMTPIARYKLADALPVLPQVTQQLAQIRTRLNSFNEMEQCALINWGYAVCDAAMRRYVASGAAPPTRLPYPACPLDQPLSTDVKTSPHADLPDRSEAP